MAEDKPDDFLGRIMDYEAGEMDDEDVVALFQELIDSGMIWQLQGSYQRTALALIEAGYITPKPKE